MFLATFLIMLREGLEAALIVSIIASYLKQTGNQSWMKYAWGGIAAAVVLCTVIGVALYLLVGELPQKAQELFEGVVAIIAVIVLTYMIFWMRKAARSMKTSLHGQLDTVLNRSTGQGVVLVGMVFFAVAREGLESLFFLFSFFEQDNYMPAVFGSVAGVMVAVGLGMTIYKGSMRLNLRMFFRITGVLILFVAAGMAASALTKFHEAGIWNVLQTQVFDVSNTALSHNTILGSLLAGLFGFNDHPNVGEVGAYFLYLIPALAFFFWPEQKSDQVSDE